MDDLHEMTVKLNEIFFAYQEAQMVLEEMKRTITPEKEHEFRTGGLYSPNLPGTTVHIHKFRDTVFKLMRRHDGSFTAILQTDMFVTMTATRDHAYDAVSDMFAVLKYAYNALRGAIITRYRQLEQASFEAKTTERQP